MADPCVCAMNKRRRARRFSGRLFTPDASTGLLDLDRAVIGSAVPTVSALTLRPPELRSDYFLERRELGVLNTGGPGTVTVDGVPFELDKLDCLMQVAEVSRLLSQVSRPLPGAFYLLSYLAHTYVPQDGEVRRPEGAGAWIGRDMQQRTIYKAIYRDGIQTASWLMGFTLLATGSNWNTMPAPTHNRRSEVYFYFDVEPDQRVVHLMGPPDATAI